MRGTLTIILGVAAVVAYARAQDLPDGHLPPSNFGVVERATVGSRDTIFAPDEALSRVAPGAHPGEPVSGTAKKGSSDSVRNTDATEQPATSSLDTTAPTPTSQFGTTSIKPGTLSSPGTNFILNLTVNMPGR
jgi:hypothetical protein